LRKVSSLSVTTISLALFLCGCEMRHIQCAYFGFANLPDPTPPPKISCVAEKHSDMVLNSKTGKEEERSNWTARCEIRQDGNLLYATPLTLPYPATKHDAYDAIDEFMDHKAPQILQSIKKGETPK
jgi:hypothetical protein